jgi:hypothetical protein
MHTSRPQQTRPTTPQSAALTTLKQKLNRGNQLISQALDLDEETTKNSRMDKAELLEKAKTTLKLYLGGGEILKTILNFNDQHVKLSK